MSRDAFFSWSYQSHQAYLERQARREANHRAYLERQARREANHRAYLERQARREANRAAYFERVTNNVLRFRAQFENILNDVKRQGLDVFVKQEFDEITQKLQRIGSLLDSDNVEAARDLSLEVGQSVHGLIPLARKAKRNAERKEWQEKLEEARRQEEEERRLIEEKRRQEEEVRRLVEEKRRQDEEERRLVEEKRRQEEERRRLEEEERRQEEEIRRKACQDFIDQMKHNLEQDKDSNPEAVEESVKNLDRLKEKIETMSESELQEKLTEESDKVDGEIADETIRRQVVFSIHQSLKKAGFIVNHPQVDGDLVVLRAQKPAGQQAVFTVKLDGGLTYKFDNYEGQKCREDIDEVTKALDECYGVKLSSENVRWSNPDRIQKGSKENPSGGGAKSSSNG